MNKKTFFDVKALADGKSADVFIMGEITAYADEQMTETSSEAFKKQLDALGDVSTINVYVNSPGGSVAQGTAIGNMLKRHKAYVIGNVDALAASIASNIIASCDEVRMYSNTMLMIHNAMGSIFGNAKDIRKYADDLDRINNMQVETYMAKVGDKTTEENIRALMDAETWLSAKEAYELGLCDVVEGSNQMVACISKDYASKFKNIPEALLKVDEQTSANVLTDAERQNIIADSKANLTYMKTLNLL